MNRARLWPHAALLAVLLLALGLRWLLLLGPHGEMEADEAIVGLMGLHILQGERPAFYYMQPYMGSLEAYLAAGSFALLGSSPLTLKLVPLLASVAFVGLIYATGVRIGGRPVGLASGTLRGPASGLRRPVGSQGQGRIRGNPGDRAASPASGHGSPARPAPGAVARRCHGSPGGAGDLDQSPGPGLPGAHRPVHGRRAREAAPPPLPGRRCSGPHHRRLSSPRVQRPRGTGNRLRHAGWHRVSGGDTNLHLQVLPLQPPGAGRPGPGEQLAPSCSGPRSSPLPRAGGLFPP